MYTFIAGNSPTSGKDCTVSWVLYIPDKPTGVEALEAFKRHNADAIILIHGLAGKFLEYCHGDDRWHGIVIYRQKKAGAVGTMLAVDEKLFRQLQQVACKNR